MPPGPPRTKPKALNYALQLIRGDYVVLYDAEDRPHPLQLLEAWRRFETGDEWLACVQAPLQISNGTRGIIPLMFAFEYSALFRGLLPWLSGHRALLPLGGTSNHFRKNALDEIGGWDPYNVTEDADIGLRLARFGYHTGTISLPTWEDAPEALSIWLPQRTRWFKGWLQSWLVHMRSPKALLRDVGRMVVLSRADTLCRARDFRAHSSPADCRGSRFDLSDIRGRTGNRLEGAAAVCGLHQCLLWLFIVSAARHVQPAPSGSPFILADRAVHPGLLADDVGGGLARGSAPLAPPTPLGERRRTSAREGLAARRGASIPNETRLPSR